MTVALYPATVDPLIGYSVEPIYFTQRTPTKSGADVAEKLWDTPRFRIRLPYRVNVTDLATLMNFHHARSGSYEAFDFIDLHTRKWDDVYISTGDGTEVRFEVPFANISAQVVKVDGVTQVGVTDYTVSAGTGENGRDRIQFEVGSTPPDGDVITLTVPNENRFYTVRFEKDNIQYRTLPTFTSGAENLELNVSLISQR